MTTNVIGGSAKIYDFPARGRFAVGGDRDDRNVAMKFGRSLANTVYGNAWYHDEAVQDDERPRTN
jgi:hypothetical protein